MPKNQEYWKKLLTQVFSILSHEKFMYLLIDFWFAWPIVANACQEVIVSNEERNFKSNGFLI